MLLSPQLELFCVAPDATVHSAFQRAPARARPATASPHAPELPLRLRLRREDAPIPPSLLSRRGPGFSSLPTPTPPNKLVPEATEGLHFPLPGRPVGQPPFPSPSRPHPRVQRGRGLPHAAASASSPRGSWCLPGPTGLTRTTQPQDVRSDGTTASCHAPPLPPPPASSPPRISPPTPPSRAQDESKAEGGQFAPHVKGRAYLCQPLSPFRNSTFLLNRSEVGLGGRGPEAGHGLGGKGRRPAETLRLREASRTGRRPWQEGNGSGSCAVAPHAPPESVPRFPHLVLRRRISREPRGWLTGAVALQ